MRLSQLKSLVAQLEATCDANQDPKVEFYCVNKPVKSGDYFCDLKMDYIHWSNLNYYYNLENNVFQLPLTQC